MRLLSFASVACACALAILVGGAVVAFPALEGCGTYACCGACPGSGPAVFDLTCSPTGVEKVVATGPCAMPDAGLGSYLGNDAVFVRSTDAGACHVDLTFVTGFTYSADVTFASKSGGVCGGPQCKCPDIVTPTSGPFQVQNPSATCIEAGAPGGPACVLTAQSRPVFSSVTPAGDSAACTLSVAQANSILVGGGCTSTVSSSSCSASINCGGEFNLTINVSGHSFTGTVGVVGIGTPFCSYDVAGTVQ